MLTGLPLRVGDGRRILCSFKLLLALKGLGGFLTVELCEARDYHLVLFCIVQRVHKEFFLHRRSMDIYNEIACIIDSKAVVLYNFPSFSYFLSILASSLTF